MRISETFTTNQMMILINKLNHAIKDEAIKIDFNYDTETKVFTINYWKDYERSETP